MAALVLACKQIWGHVQTCATAVKMANLKYYSFEFKFSQSFLFFFFFAVYRTLHLTRISRLLKLKQGLTGSQGSLFGYRRYRSLSGSFVS